MHPLAHRFAAAAGAPAPTDAPAAESSATDLTRPTRRGFLLGAAAVGAGLTIAFSLTPEMAAAQGAAPKPPTPNPFGSYLHIAADGTVTVKVAHMDMGQGVYHGVASLVMEELGGDWSRLVVEGAAGNPKLYGNVAMGGAFQLTGGSTAMFSSWDRYRTAGALARTLLVEAAAADWKVPAGEITVASGTLSHKSGKSAGFGTFADAAAKLPVPSAVTLKSPDQWTVIGKETVRRFDSRAKTTGSQTFTIDVTLPGMLTALVAHPPVFGATVRSLDDKAARAVPGVVDVVRISRGVAVVAKNTWAAMKGREALTVDWDTAKAELRGSDALWAEYRALGEKPGPQVSVERGNVAGALDGSSKTITATYEFPFLAHAALEPLDAVARMDNGVLEVWGGHQVPDVYQQTAAQIAGVTPDKVVMHVMKTGGGFGRRAVLDSDIVVEAVETAKAIGWTAPVKVLWTREDDMAGGRYRPMMLHKVTAGIDKDGNPTGWYHRIVGQSILAGTPFAGPGVDPAIVEGVSDTRYGLPHLKVEVATTTVGVPVLWWRSVGHTHTAYVMETMVDELAATAGKDPVAYRRTLLANHPRHLAVLNLAAEKAGWGTALPAGRARGVAIHESFGSVVAQVVEASLENGMPRVHKVVAAVDCGTAINPDQIRSQVEGGVGFGLGAILAEELTLTDGKVDQLNYDAYTPLRIESMPMVEVHIVPSTNTPSGIGEPGVPPIGPAVANAVRALSGRTVRVLPMSKGLSA
ncbi:MAG: hypothetical protein RLY86_3023 [Pseudomonadota bacterium]|jgi:isoquinoline 1-oxidoreductase beta subunit